MEVKNTFNLKYFLLDKPENWKRIASDTSFILVDLVDGAGDNINIQHVNSSEEFVKHLDFIKYNSIKYRVLENNSNFFDVEYIYGGVSVRQTSFLYLNNHDYIVISLTSDNNTYAKKIAVFEFVKNSFRRNEGKSS